MLYRDWNLRTFKEIQWITARPSSLRKSSFQDGQNSMVDIFKTTKLDSSVDSLFFFIPLNFCLSESLYERTMTQ